MTNPKSTRKAEVTAAMDKTVQTQTAKPAVITLDVPIRRGNQVIEEVTLRRPLAGELRGLSLNDLLTLKVDALQQLLPRITEPMIFKEEIAKLDPADLVSLGAEAVSFFLTKSQREGLPTE